MNAWPRRTPACSTTARACWSSASSSRARASWSTRLVDAPVCPVDDDVATAVPDRRAARRGRSTSRSSADADAARADDDRRWTSSPTTSASRATPATQGDASHAEIGLPAQAPRAAGWCSSTPRASAGSARRTAPRRRRCCRPRTPCCSSPTPPRSTPRRSWSSSPQAMRLCPNVACVVTKTDLYPDWRRIIELDRGHLDARGSRRRSSPSRPRCAARREARGRRRQRRVRLPPSWSTSCASGCVGRGRRAGPPRDAVHDVLAVTEQIAGQCWPSWRPSRTRPQPPRWSRELTEAKAAGRRAQGSARRAGS